MLLLGTAAWLDMQAGSTKAGDGGRRPADDASADDRHARGGDSCGIAAPHACHRALPRRVPTNNPAAKRARLGGAERELLDGVSQGSVTEKRLAACLTEHIERIDTDMVRRPGRRAGLGYPLSRHRAGGWADERGEDACWMAARRHDASTPQRREARRSEQTPRPSLSLARSPASAGVGVPNAAGRDRVAKDGRLHPALQRVGACIWPRRRKRCGQHPAPALNPRGPAPVPLPMVSSWPCAGARSPSVVYMHARRRVMPACTGSVFKTWSREHGCGFDASAGKTHATAPPSLMPRAASSAGPLAERPAAPPARRRPWPGWAPSFRSGPGRPGWRAPRRRFRRRPAARRPFLRA